MNPFNSYSQLLFTCVNGPISEVAELVLERFNIPNQWSARDAKGNPITQFFLRETAHDLSLAYVDRAEKDGTKTNRILIWEPAINPGNAVLMGRFNDGLSHSIFRISEHSPRVWVNVRINANSVYPAYFFDYYADYRRIERRLMACKDENGWDVVQKGDIQPFENQEYYIRRLKKDRLTQQIITEYLEKLGYFIQKDDFWRTNKPALYIWQQRPVAVSEQK